MTSRLGVVAGIVVAVALCGALARYLFRLFNAMGAETLLKNMRDRLFEQILHLPCAWYGGQQTGDIIQRCTSDVETVKTFVAERLTSLLRISVMLVMALYYMRLIHGGLTLAAFAFIPVIVGYSFIFHRRIGSAFAEVDIQEGKLSAIAQENLTGVRVVRAFGRELHERKRFETQNQRYTDMWVRLMKILTLFWCTSDLVSGLQILTVVALGAVFCVRGSLGGQLRGLRQLQRHADLAGAGAGPGDRRHEQGGHLHRPHTDDHERRTGAGRARRADPAHRRGHLL